MTLRRSLAGLAPLGLAALLALTAPTRGADSPVLARVNGEPISLDRLLDALAEGEQDLSALLQHLVDTELIVQQARAMGLDDLPEYAKAVAAYREDTLRDALLEHHANEAAPPDPVEVEKIYRERAAEVEISSIEFARLEPAQAFFEALRRGGDFGSTARVLVEQQQARNPVDRAWFRRSALLPDVSRALEPLAADQFTPPFPLSGGFAVIRLHARRVADDPPLHEAVERELGEAMRVRALPDNLELEAQRLGLDRDPLLVAGIEEHERTTLVRLFVAKVVDPSIEVGGKNTAEYRAKREALVAEWTRKLRAASNVEILVEGERLRELVAGANPSP